MDWLYLHRTKKDYYEKSIEYLDDKGEQIFLRGKKKATSIRMVTTMQAKHSSGKGCVLFAVQIYSDKGKEMMQMFLVGIQLYNSFRMYFLHIFQIFHPTGK